MVLAMRHLEHEHQAALMRWAQLVALSGEDVLPGAILADYLIAIPNGGGRSKIEAARLKAEGVKAGVFDLYLPLARGGFHGLWIELKRPKSPGAPAGRMTSDQKSWGGKMELAGYRAVCSHGWQDAAEALQKYLNGSLA